MAELDLPIIDKTVHKTRLWLDDVMAATETMDRARAYRALRAVLHALRDTLDFDTAVRFAAQLPLLVRGLYYEGWRPQEAAHIVKAADFVGLVAGEFGDFPTFDLERICRGVYRVCRSFLTSGEMSEVSRALPPEVRQLLESASYRHPGETLT